MVLVGHVVQSALSASGAWREVEGGTCERAG
jgi:hypothetical protein